MSHEEKTRPYFSVVITAYNRETLIARALDSLIQQTEKDWEAIIIDDGSTDRTNGKLFPYLKMFSQIKYIRQRHSGCESSRNRGIMEAEGEYITFLDSDDEYSPGHLSIRKVMLLQNPGVRFLYGGARILGNKYVPDRTNMNRKIDLKRCAIGGTFVIERNLAREMKGFITGKFGADADFYYRIREAKIKRRKAAQLTYIYHHENEDSVTNRIFAGL